MQRWILVPLVLALAAGTAAASFWVSSSSFLSASAGSALPFTRVALPLVDLPQPGGQGQALHAVAIQSPWKPSIEQLLHGETVITSDAQMRDAWRRLFSVPYDASQFDFEREFVVLMGGGELASGSFDISDVERVEASYENAGGMDGDSASELFLAVTARTFLPGVQKQDPPPPTFRVSAVKIAKDDLDDVVFHRRVVMGI